MEHMTDMPDGEEVLFYENGASWLWVLTGPVAAVGMVFIQRAGGGGMHVLVPLAFLVLVSGFVALQVKAARIHTSVELTADALRQGTVTTLVDEIVTIYPEPPPGGHRHYDGRLLDRSNALTNRALQRAGIDQADLESESEPADDTERAAEKEAAALAEKWQSARALGELVGVPRGRTGIGLKLTGDRTAQAWARRHQDLRAALTPLVQARRGPQPGGPA